MEQKKEQVDGQENTEGSLSPEESAQLDADLLGIDMLYRSRCVQAPVGSNVKIREIDRNEK